MCGLQTEVARALVTKPQTSELGSTLGHAEGRGKAKLKSDRNTPVECVSAKGPTGNRTYFQQFRERLLGTYHSQLQLCPALSSMIASSLRGG